jgi:hypothetical protein
MHTNFIGQEIKIMQIFVRQNIFCLKFTPLISYYIMFV